MRVKGASAERVAAECSKHILAGSSLADSFSGSLAFNVLGPSKGCLSRIDCVVEERKEKKRLQIASNRQISLGFSRFSRFSASLSLALFFLKSAFRKLQDLWFG